MTDMPSTSATAPATTTKHRRNSPYLPAPSETVLLAIFPGLLLFGALFRVLSPQAATVSSPSPPSYFARKDNVLNIFFVKRGWFWISVAFAAFVSTHPFLRASAARQRTAVTRWALVTGWWILVTQWCFGPALIDRSFRLTGGECAAVVEAAEVALHHRAPEAAVTDPRAQLAIMVTAAACKSAGGRWQGGHDISGHVFLLVLGSTFLAQEVGWVLWRGKAATRMARASGGATQRAVVMSDGVVKAAEVEMPGDVEVLHSGGGGRAGIGAGTAVSDCEPTPSKWALRLVSTVVGLSGWMLLMTVIFFHSWFEKLTGLLVALTGFYAVYIVPRWMPAVRRVVGVPGV